MNNNINKYFFIIEYNYNKISCIKKKNFFFYYSKKKKKKRRYK